MIRRFRPISALIALAAAATCALTGCVERKITIVSDPPGALVWVNDVEVGRTPVEFPFTWYGDYDVRFRLEQKSGTEEHPITRNYFLHTHKQAHAPIYEWMGIDLITESLIPITFKDEKIWAFTLPEVVEPNDQDLIARARELQNRMNNPTGFEKKSKSTPPATTNPSTLPNATPPAPPPAIGPTTQPLTPNPKP